MSGAPGSGRAAPLALGLVAVGTYLAQSYLLARRSGDLDASRQTAAALRVELDDARRLLGELRARTSESDRQGASLRVELAQARQTADDLRQRLAASQARASRCQDNGASTLRNCPIVLPVTGSNTRFEWVVAVRIGEGGALTWQNHSVEDPEMGWNVDAGSSLILNGDAIALFSTNSNPARPGDQQRQTWSVAGPDCSFAPNNVAW